MDKRDLWIHTEMIIDGMIVEALITIAHLDFRAKLRKHARNFNLL